jgi:uncharacterized protein
MLLLIALLSLTAVWHARQLAVDTSMEVWFLDDDPDLVSYRAFLSHFNTDQVIVMVWEDPQLWTAEGLAFVDQVTKAAEGLRLPFDEGATLEQGAKTFGVQRARSITTMSEVVAEPGMLTVAPLYDVDEPPDPAVLRERVLADEKLVGGLVSADGQVAAVVLDVDPLVENIALKARLARALTDLSAELGAERGLRIACAGPTMLDDAFYRYTQRDMMTVIPGMGLVILIAILLLFRSMRALALPMAVVSVTSVLVAGLMVVFGLKITIVHTIVFPMVLGIGVASSVHVITRAMNLRRAGSGPGEAAQQSLASLLAPCFFTMATTVAGLLSLLTASLAPVRELGGLGASGAALSFLLTFAFGPWLLPLLPNPQLQGGSLERMWLSWDRMLGRLGEAVQRHAGFVSLGAVLLLLLSLLGLFRLDVGSNPLNYFTEDEPVRVALEFVEEKLTGTTSLEILIDTGKSGGMKDPAVLSSMVTVQEYLGALEGIGSTLSLADFVIELRSAFHGGVDHEARVPDSRAEVAQLLVMLDDSSSLEQWVDFDFQRGRINATLRMGDADELVKEVAGVEALLAQEFRAPVRAYATGMSKLISKMESYLLNSQIRSLCLAFVTVLVCMILALGNLRLGLFSMIPNLLPIGMSLGLMGWFGMTLDPGTAMTGAVALGLVVDDTVHFLHHLRSRLLVGDVLSAAIASTLRETGRAIAMTSIVLVAGFWLMCLASFVPNIQFGFLCGLAIALALLANLIVLPAVLALFEPSIQD